MNFLIKPDFDATKFSLALPSQPSDIKLTEAIRYVAVLWYL